MNLWPCGTPKSTNNAFDMSEIRPSCMASLQEANRAQKQLAIENKTAQQRFDETTAMKPITQHTVIAPSKGGFSFYPK